jgi:uncharacterized protein YdeI (BOF family)
MKTIILLSMFVISVTALAAAKNEMRISERTQAQTQFCQKFPYSCANPSVSWASIN